MNNRLPLIRKISTVVLLCLCCTPARSQVLISLLFGDKLNSGKIAFGLDGGLNLSSQGGLISSNPLSGFNLWFYFDIKVKQSPRMLHTCVIVKSNVGGRASGLFAEWPYCKIKLKNVS